MDQALRFLQKLPIRVSTKILYSIDKAKIHTDPELFKKIGFDLWEFRIHYAGLQYRLLAFWDKSSTAGVVVITHGFIKKRDRIPLKEIKKAVSIRSHYYRS